MKTRPIIWQSLALMPPLDPAAVEAALTGLCLMAGAPIITLEARGADHLVTWRLGCDATDLARVRDVLRAHVPALYLPRSTGNATAAYRAARISFAGSQHRPFAPKDVEPITRSVLGSLSRAGQGESATLQVTLGPRRRPRIVRESGQVEHLAHKDAVEKNRDPRFTVDLRIGATADRPDRVRSLINSVMASARTLEVPGVRVSAAQTSTDGFISASLPWFWRSHLTPRELIALTAWPLTDQMPGIPTPHPRRLHPTAVIPKTGLVLGHAVDDPKRPIALKLTDTARSIQYIGPPGVGKSNLLASGVLQMAAAGRGVIAVDGKGDLADEILSRLPDDRLDDLVLVEPWDDAPAGLASFHGDPERTAETLLAVFHSLYENNWGIYSSTVFQGVLLTLARRGDASIPMIPTLLNNPGFRHSITGRLVREDPMGLGAFWAWFESLSESERQTAVGPVMRKLQPLLVSPAMRHLFGQPHPRFELADVFTKNRILIANMAKGRMGLEASRLAGSVLVSLLADAVMARASVPVAKRSPVMFFIDEFQDYVRFGGAGDFGDALAQFRGLGVGLGLAHQHMAQLSPSLRDGLISNARTRIMFGLGHRDATDFARMSRGLVEGIDLETLPAYEAYASIFIDGAAAPWVSLKTDPLGPRTIDPELVRSRSRANYGVSGSETDEYLRGLIEPPSPSGERFGRTPRPSGGAS